MAGGGRRAGVAALALLSTGTTLALYGQVVTNLRLASPSSQLIAWAKYSVNYLLLELIRLLGMGRSTTPGPARPLFDKHSIDSIRAEQLATIIGVVDIVAYTLSCLGFPLCGSALTMVVFAASGQIFTAVIRVVLLHRTLSRRQQQALAVVITGLLIRASPWRLIPAASSKAMPMGDTGGTHQLLLGVAYIMASAFLYSLIGVLYEKLFSLPGNHLTLAQVNKRVSLTGVVAMTAYQALYTWPRRQSLVLQPLAKSGMSNPGAILVHCMFGAFYTLHSMAQGWVLANSGAMAVGIINAMRAAVVTAASALLFCTPEAPQQCWSMPGAASAATITAGVVLWVTAQPSKAHGGAPATGAVQQEDHAPQGAEQKKAM